MARFKSNQVKAMKGLEYALSNLQGRYTLPEIKGECKGKKEEDIAKQFIFNCYHFWKGGKTNTGRKAFFLKTLDHNTLYT